MVHIEEFTKRGWSKERFLAYFNKVNKDVGEGNQPLHITYTVPDGISANGFKKSLRRLKNKLLYLFNDVAVMYKFEFDQLGKTHAHILVGGDDAPNKKWIMDRLKEDDSNDASKS